jgi:hypothetical protein
MVPCEHLGGLIHACVELVLQEELLALILTQGKNILIDNP